MFDKKKQNFGQAYMTMHINKTSLYKKLYRKLSESSVNRKINEF